MQGSEEQGWDAGRIRGKRVQKLGGNGAMLTVQWHRGQCGRGNRDVAPLYSGNG